jgi:translation initiation factor 1 (eIF-1/SUI1)
VRGLEGFGLANREVASLLRVKFACSVSTGQVNGHETGNEEIVVQGNWAAELEELLAKLYGIPRQTLSVTTGKGVKPKKQG